MMTIERATDLAEAISGVSTQLWPEFVRALNLTYPEFQWRMRTKQVGNVDGLASDDHVTWTISVAPAPNKRSKPK